MGREKTILLGLLGLLGGVFVGALSLKLLVPRPPTGTGPDIRAAADAITPQERVEPPAPTPRGWDFAAAPPLVPEPPAASPSPDAATSPQPDAAAGSPDPLPPADAAPVPEPPVMTEPPRFGRFATPVPPSDTPAAGGPIVDPAVTPAAWRRSEPVDLTPPETPAAPLSPGGYVVRPGDSWWDLAERAYGDGRLYRALFAWNRSRDPRITLAPGTRLDVPALDRLEAAWPRLAAPR